MKVKIEPIINTETLTPLWGLSMKKPGAKKMYVTEIVGGRRTILVRDTEEAAIRERDDLQSRLTTTTERKP